MISSIASSSVSTKRSMSPVLSACSRQPPSASRSTCSPIAIDTSRELDTHIVEPFFITAKSDTQHSHADDPNEVSSAAAAHGLSRVRRNCVGSLPRRRPIPRAPIVSGSRAPVDSPMWTSGKPFSVATRRMCPIFFELVALVDAPFTVKSLTHTATSRPSIRANPAILPSRGVLATSSANIPDAPRRPVSTNEPSSTR